MPSIPWIDERSLVREHPLIDHYTDLKSFSNIISSGALRATPFDETNDISEFRALESVIADRMLAGAPEKIKAAFKDKGLVFNGTGEQFLEVCEADTFVVFNALLKSMPVKPQIVCFSFPDTPSEYANGLLTQWRLYGDDGAGVALRFNSEKIREITEEIVSREALDVLFLDKVGYGENADQTVSRLSEFDRLSDLYVDSVISALSGRDQFSEDRADDLTRFFVLATTSKHEDFRDEREIRLVANEPVTPEKCDLVRDNGRLLIPCLSGLESVIVGPSDNQQAVKELVAGTLADHGLTDIAIYLSETPYRSVRNN